MKKNVSWLSMVAVVALGGCAGTSSQKPQESPIYWVDSSGAYVRDSSGHCVRTIHWTAQRAIAGCEGGAPAKAAAPAPAPAKVEPAPAPAPVVAPAPKPQPTVEKVSLKAGALFDVNKADLKSGGKSELDALVAKIKGSNTQVEQITVTGHTDSAGSKQLNQGLSERRAEAVKTYLVSQGLDGSRIDTRGAGDTQPVASNKTAEGRAQNRRVEIDIKAQRTTSVN